MNKTTEQHRKNLKQLADYLLSLPKDYKSFDMQQFVETQGSETDIEKRLIEGETVPQCGAVACAMGHSTDAGLSVSSYMDGESIDWRQTGIDLYGVDSVRTGEAWDWAFSSDWADLDNTPQGAGKRILYLLSEHYAGEEFWEVFQSHNPKQAYKEIMSVMH